VFTERSLPADDVTGISKMHNSM